MAADTHTLTGPYVLDALPDEERAEFERHLAECAWCVIEVTELTETAVRLAGTVATVPPAALKSRLLAQVARTSQLPPAAEPGPDTAGPEQPGSAAGPEQPGTELPGAARPSRAERRYGRRDLLTLAAAGLVVAGTGAVAVDRNRDADRARRATGQAAQEAAQAQRDADQLAALLAQPDARTVRGAVTGGGQATVVASRRRDAAIVVVDGLPEAPQDREYQLWFIESPTFARSLGLLGRRPGTTRRLIEGGIARAAAFGITIEPAGGSAQPSSQPIAALPLA